MTKATIATTAGDIVNVPFERPRDRLGIGEDPRFHQIRSQLLGFLEARAHGSATAAPRVDRQPVETKNPELNATREKAEEILGRVSNWDSRKQKMAQAFTQGSKRSSRSLQWIGWVGVQGDKRICLLKKAEPGLELVAISYADRKSEIVKLGVCSEASFPLPDNAASLPVGSAIYALTATD